MFARKMIRSVLVVACLSAFVPVTAFADEARRKDGSSEKAKERKVDRAKFPMPAAKFKEMIEKRISKAQERITKGLEKRNVPEATRKEALARFEKGATQVRTAADAAAKDGTVTLEEAKSVRELAKSLQKDARTAMKNDKGKGKGKGKGNAKNDVARQ
jgi:NhaP-type Na+/H+ and K+/H+ antiporter